jgi:hypothetical protein
MDKKIQRFLSFHFVCSSLNTSLFYFNPKKKGGEMKKLVDSREVDSMREKKF